VYVGQRDLPEQPNGVTQESTRLGQTIATAFLTVREEQILRQQGYDQGRQHPQTQMERVELPGEGHPVQQKQNEYEERIHELNRGRFGKKRIKKEISVIATIYEQKKQLEPNRNHAPREKMPAFIPKPHRSGNGEDL